MPKVTRSRVQADAEALSASTKDVVRVTAERLFALEGIAAVSARRVADVAGEANNSVVSYYFGGKRDLVVAVLRYHLDQTREISGAMRREAPPADLRDYVELMVRPLVRHLAAEPAPTYYARFLLAIVSDPQWRSVLAEELAEPVVAEEYGRQLRRLIPAVDPHILRSRGNLVRTTVTNACAEFEARLERGEAAGDWGKLGTFLVDALCGMLAAPSTQR
ncbi:TetR/AcrR family transcriptional regulator [Kribbella sandramycini]|uniref:AcrR family transcriptional regulator n=1 Tax=Kribbella sandramycini TaxID=60450 RepID=A0A7Y4KVW1_9ACTN|nr:TetR family transcriptional regulator [Kribbella sandramycini]MBB6567710.1 AcrR family transcriptional regulator [Kribbella sandramycini]NOL39690.1 TetR/AcrR family transcriptional regulator [Kribbella sandramycini]